MGKIREQIMEQTRFARMRMGQLVGDDCAIPSMPELRVKLVPLTEAEVMAGITRAAGVDAPDNTVGMQLWNRTVRESDVWHAMREPEDLQQKVFATPEEMTELLTPDDIDIIADKLVALTQMFSTSLADMDGEEVTRVKELLARIEPSALTGRPAAALVLLLSVLTPTSLRDNSPSSTSTP